MGRLSGNKNANLPGNMFFLFSYAFFTLLNSPFSTRERGDIKLFITLVPKVL